MNFMDAQQQPIIPPPPPPIRPSWQPTAASPARKGAVFGWWVAIFLAGCTTQPTVAPPQASGPVDVFEAMQRERDYYKQQEQERRAQYVKDHPQLRPAFAQDILDGKVAVGMTPDDVKASWGKPGMINSSGGVNGSFDQWCYHDSSFLYFTDGLLTSWQVQKQP
jgi:hypothetical protein